ncbi:MAG: PilX N-terminal domain-containing pilus assembly protein [Gammaproteobacteria bacterium]
MIASSAMQLGRNSSLRAHSTGIALVGALWVIALLSIIVAGVSATTRSEVKVVRNLITATQAQYAAEAGLNLAIVRLLSPQSAGLLTDGSIHEFEVANTQIRLAATDEAGKIDLNHAPPELLNFLLTGVGIPYEHSLAIVDAILDFRDGDHMRHLQGAEDEDYQLAGLPYEAKDADFETVSELRLVPGMNATIYAAIEPVLTVHSRHQGINPSVASLTALRILSGGDYEAVGTYIAERDPTRVNFTGYGAPGFIPGSFVTSAAGQAYTIDVESRTETGTVAQLSATVAIQRGGKRARYAIVNWGHSDRRLFQEHDAARQDPPSTAFGD